MRRVENSILDFVKEVGNDEIIKIFNEISKGKMLRSKLILKVAGESEEAIKLSSIIEMIHLASLLHDDVIDDADVRRGQPSINASFGNKISIMLGDILYSKAFFELSKFNEEIAKVVSNAVTLLSVGEFLDVQLTDNFNSDREIYFDMVYKKTSSLIEASAKASAILVGKNSDKFGLYGKNLGIAFQIVDDILDITQSSEKLGKPAMSDFKEGKTTLPYILLYEKLEDDDKGELETLFKKNLNEYEINWLKDKFELTGSINEAFGIAISLAHEGMEAVKNEDADELISIMKSMIEREF